MLSTGKVTLEDVKGKTGVEATQILTGQGLVVQSENQESGDAEPGVVLDQNPAAGERVDPNSTVTLTLAAPPPPPTTAEPSPSPTDSASPTGPTGQPTTPSPSASPTTGTTGAPGQGRSPTKKPPGGRPTQPPSN